MYDVRIEVEEEVALLVLDREQKLNAMNRDGWLALRDAVSECAARSLRGVVITGAGANAFVAGADIAEMLPRPPLAALDALAQQVVEEITELPMLTVAALNGLALGGGFEIALACDFRVATAHAKVGFPELGLGLVPGAGGTSRLLAHVGIGLAREMILLGRLLDAAEARDLGIVSRIAPQPELVPTARAMIDAAAAKGPVAVRLAKMLLKAASAQPAGPQLERLAYTVAFLTEDRKEGMASFVERRAPSFTGT